MALTPSEKKELEAMVRKEIKDFLGEPTVKKFESSLVKKIGKELKSGELRPDFNEIFTNMMAEFYYTMWTRKNTWQSSLKNKK
jgi:hypothetical protein